MGNKPLVSMITYCYNGERFVTKYFESILAQTYPNIELIFFNNGSSDATGEIAEKYKKLLEQKGINVNLIHYQENQSTCLLKQKAFQMMNGEYFFGCDSDDLMDPDYIYEMESFLEQNPDKGIVYCQLRMVQEETSKVLGIMKMKPRVSSKEAFKDILRGENINFTALSYMMSRKHFEAVNPEKRIYISSYGENYQIQMPFLFHDLQGYIEKPLGQYTVRKDSYTGTLTILKKIKALKGQEQSVLATLEQIGMTEMEEYKTFFLKRIRKERFYCSLHYNDKSIAQECLKEYKESGSISIRDLFAWTLYRMGLFNSVVKLKNKIRNKDGQL